MYKRFVLYWSRLNDVLDLPGGTWMSLFTAGVVLRIFMVLDGKAPLTAAEAAAYGSAIGAYAYSNRGPK